MTMKRWIAIIVAAVLIFISVGVNSLSYIFTRDVNGFLEQMGATNNAYSEKVIEQGTNRDRIAVLKLDGVIQDVGSSIFATTGYNHQFFMSQLNDVLNDQSVKGVILSVNTPGGGVVESSDIYDSIREIQIEKEIPIYVAMGGMAASGGYYVSAPAEKIFVHPETITGSIGVIMESINYSKLAEKYGIDFNTIKTGPYKDIMSGSREMTKEEHNMLQEMVNDSYERFVGIVAEGRNMSTEAVKKVADGRIMNGRQAIESGLADEVGKLGDVIDAIKADYKLEGATVFEYAPMDSFASIFGVNVGNLFGRNVESELIGKLLSDYDAPRMMYLYGEK
ncbi:signal peptide peptidase SppA [Sporosarcina thermotolerans]|uniref:Signal peptide peptidase SppA n=1 Tax=Sporosarcina thermotolerans TaxID=633404 RepID=A0AAW9ADT4_9BACL|nr:signal peptide peptidase SppA [Sporosarcina thermotolerans]MDW0118485.1 signal peptide peptidase SppA [Sporosarcina thermotolerans]WHT47742.1 signal peptide peptidase SppA [Sporosarcina thermotolerans]